MLEPLRIPARRRLAGLLARELSVAEATIVLMAAFLVSALLGELLAPQFVSGVLAPGFDAPTSFLTARLTRIMLFQPLILAVGSVATAVLHSRNQFLLTAFSMASYNLSLIGGIIAAWIWPELGIYGPTFGVVVGALLQVVILLPGLIGSGARLRLTIDLADARLREVVRLLIPNGASMGVNYAGFILDTAFASGAPERAGLAAIQNAWLLVGVPIALLGQAIGQSAFPRMANHAAAADWAAMRRSLARSLGVAVALALLATLGLIFLGRDAIRLLFERGKFDAAAGALTYQVMAAYAMALPFAVATEVLTRGLIALRDTRTPLITNTCQLAGRAALLTFLVGQLGVFAIPIAFAITGGLEAMLLGVVLLLGLRRRSRKA
jgi:putative peptidoglycan lipid II flippase